jgi:hypothetical protein
MHIYANRAYLELFACEDADELEHVPMIDLIGSSDKPASKTSLSYHGAEGPEPNSHAGIRPTAKASRR